MAIALWCAVLLGALAVLVVGADRFVEHAAAAARAYGVPQFVVGASIVAVGTSLPELAASLASVFHGAGGFVAGTVVGSNVTNILLVLGAAAVAFRGGVSISTRIARLDVPVMLLAAVVITLMMSDGKVSGMEGGLLLVMYAVYLSQSLRQREAPSERHDERLGRWWWAWMAGGAVGVWVGARWTVRASVELTHLLGLGDVAIVALSVVAVGSSLPELVVSLAAARRAYYEMSVGNVVGSNICNSMLVLGLPALVRPLPVAPSVMHVGVGFMLGATVVLMAYGQVGAVGRHAGLLMLLAFALFIMQLVGAG